MAVTHKEMGASREWIESLRKWMCDEKRSQEGNSWESQQVRGNWAGLKKREEGWERSGRRIHRGRVPGAKSRDGFEKERAVKSAMCNGVVK